MREQQSSSSKVSKHLNCQRRTGKFCDVQIEIQNGSAVFGHFSVIAPQSEVLQTTYNLQDDMIFSIQTPLKVTLNDFACEQCLQAVQDYFYEDIICVPAEHEPHIKELARLLGVSELEGLLCSEYIQKAEPTNECLDLAAVSKEYISHSQLSEDVFVENGNYYKIDIKETQDTSSKIIACIGCDFQTYRVHDMILHLSSCEYSNQVCSLCEIGFTERRDYDAHLKKHTTHMKKPFFCLNCDIRFPTRASLLLHLPKHSHEAPHLCSVCGKSFKWQQGLKGHMLIHNKIKPMLCDVCGYSTTNMKSLKSHKLQHTGNLYTCNYPNCKHTTNRKENLKHHFATHKHEKPFVCEICGCKFSQSKNLRRHAMKHEPNNERKYQCQLCSFSSHRSDKLKEHVQRVHTEKQIQLELPEIVDNAFEVGADDAFDLPILSSRKRKSIRRMKQRNRTCNTDTVFKHRCKPLAPKPFGHSNG